MTSERVYSAGEARGRTPAGFFAPIPTVMTERRENPYGRFTDVELLHAWRDVPDEEIERLIAGGRPRQRYVLTVTQRALADQHYADATSIRRRVLELRAQQRQAVAA